jgi:PAS domain S-box-containing protein
LIYAALRYFGLLQGLKRNSLTSSEILNFVQDESGSGYFTWNIHNHKIEISKKFGEKFSDNITHLDQILDLIHEEDKETVAKEFGIFDGSGDLYVKEVRAAEKTGSYCWISMQGRALEYSDEEIAVLKVNDLTEIKKIENQQQDLLYQRDTLLNRLRLQIDKMPIGYMITDKDFKIIFMNPAAEHIFGFTLEELKGKTPYGSIFPSEEEETIEETRHEIIDHGDTSNIMYLNARKDGKQVFCEWYNTPLWSDAGEFNLLSMIIDVTARQSAEMELIEAKEKAQESNRMKSIFLAQMSREIRTPVSTILNYTSLLEEYVKEQGEENFIEIFESIERASRKLIRTIDLILNMSQMHIGHFQANPEMSNLIMDVIEPVVIELSPVANAKGVEIGIEKLTDDIMIETDRNYASQIFSNLVDNAIKYTQKGKIIVSVYSDKKDKLCVDVKDTGIGISEDYLNSLFTPFTEEEIGYTRTFDRTGLGLALVGKYCEIVKADIAAKSKKGKGSVFTVKFNTKFNS